VLIYKILLPSEWADFDAAGRFDGSTFDHESGFIHCSSREQVGAVATFRFAGAGALVVVAIDDEMLGDSVRWEDGGGSLFPHVYGTVPRPAVVAVHRVADASLVDAALHDV
jgi:uncharacterized protein (DUF952 family)